MKLAVHIARMGQINANKMFLRRPESKRRLEIPKRRCKDNIKMDLGDIVGSVNRIHLVQG